MAAMERNEIDSRLNDLRILLVPTWTEDDTHKAQLASYQGLLVQTFGSADAQNPLSDLEGRQEYLKWRRNEHSSILHISGDTSTNHTGLCWLSHTVPVLVDNLQLEGQKVIFHLAQRQHSMQDGVPIQEIVGSVIFQLMRDCYMKVQVIVQLATCLKFTRSSQIPIVQTPLQCTPAHISINESISQEFASVSPIFAAIRILT